MTTFKVGYLIGSLATASINRKLANALVRMAPPQLEMSEVPFRVNLRHVGVRVP